MKEFLFDSGIYYVYAEYNPFFPYGGPSWWLYAIPVSELTENKELPKGSISTWLHSDGQLTTLFRGIGLPEYNSFRNLHSPNFPPDPSSYCPAFFRRYPAGVVCEVKAMERKVTKQESEYIGDYCRIVRQRQLDHIAKVQEEAEKEREAESKSL